MSRLFLWTATFMVAVITLCSQTVFSAEDSEISDLRREISEMQRLYEQKIQQLEEKLSSLETQQEQLTHQAQVNDDVATPASSKRSILPNEFNPSIGVILQGKYNSYSESESEFAGFAVGEEGERGPEGFTLDETELNFSANIDDKFRGSSTIAIVEEDGTEIELEEAYIETIGLPVGIKAGRFFASLGYLNEQHTHADDFSDRPLPYRVYLNNQYNDDGVQTSWIAPTNFYTELGAGLYRGADFPGGGEGDNDIGAWSLFGRIGGDVGDNSAWRFGLSTLQIEDQSRSSNEDILEFTGDSKIYIVDGKYVWAPNGNNRSRELILQSEFFYVDEDGTYDDTDVGTGLVNYDEDSSGWYAQSVYKLNPKWRIGARYSQLNPADVPDELVGSALDDDSHDPYNVSLMADWTNSEFSRIRLQYNHEELSDGNDDDQLTLQYIMSLGAHSAHPF